MVTVMFLLKVTIMLNVDVRQHSKQLYRDMGPQRLLCATLWAMRKTNGPKYTFLPMLLLKKLLVIIYKV